MRPVGASRAMVTPRLAKLDRKLKRLRSVEAFYRKELKRLEEEYKDGSMPRARYRRRQAKFQRRVDRRLAHIKELTARRGRLAGDR